MNTLILHDTTQLTRPVRRKITSVWAEARGSKVWVVPSTAREAAQGVKPYNLESSHRAAKVELEANVTDEAEALLTEMKLWWIEEWSDPDGVHAIRRLSPEEQQRAAEIRQHIPAGAFHCSREDMEGKNDVRIVSEALAVDGRLLVTNNLRSIQHETVNNWVKQTRAHFGFAGHDLLIQPDDWMEQEMANATPHERRKALAQLMLRAFWPWNESGSNEETAKEVLNTLKRLKNEPFERTIARAHEVIEYAQDVGDLDTWVEEVRSAPPVKTLRTEQRHPMVRGR